MLWAAQGEYHIQIILFCNHTLRWQEQLSYNQLWNTGFFFFNRELFVLRAGNCLLLETVRHHLQAAAKPRWQLMAKSKQVWSRNLLQETDASHSPTCRGSSFLDPKIWDVLPVSTAGFCLPLLLPDILCISTAAPKALAAINHFFITSSILSALQAHLYPSVFPASLNPDFHFYPPSITAIWSISLTASSFSNFLIPALPPGPSFP